MPEWPPELDSVLADYSATVIVDALKDKLSGTRFKVYQHESFNPVPDGIAAEHTALEGDIAVTYTPSSMTLELNLTGGDAIIITSNPGNMAVVTIWPDQIILQDQNKGPLMTGRTTVITLMP